MSEELRAWIANSRRVFDLSNSTEPVTDDDERRLHFDMADWAATYGPKLLDKVEELAGVLERAEAGVWDAYYGRGISVEYARSIRSEAQSALRAPGGWES